MRIPTRGPKQSESGSSILVYCFVMVTVVITMGGLASLVSQTAKVSGRRSDMIQAIQYSESGAEIACSDLNKAVTTAGASLQTNLVNGANPYALNSTLSTSQTNVYQRTISAPFTNQTVTAQIWLPNVASPGGAKIIAMATTRQVTQTAKVNVNLTWGYPAAIISVNAGTTATNVAKATGQAGNVVINGDKNGPIVVDGGSGKAVLANGRVDYDTNYLNPPSSAYSMTNWGTANQIPDYTSQGQSNALFDINRFIAVANATPLGVSPTGNNHFTNLSTFIASVKLHPPATPMQGVIVVDVYGGSGGPGPGGGADPDMNQLTSANLPNGINVVGSLVFNFTGSGWDATTSKIVVQADMNINPANLTGLVATNPATYTTGYPPAYTDPTKNPANINISPSYQNFSASDDLPALLYSIGVVDMHGGLDISGVVYTPSYIEIENKSTKTQYIKGSVIMGNGIYYENTSSAISIISFDPQTLDSLATLGSAGKQVLVSYWEP